MDKADRMIIGENIDKIRVARGMSKKQLVNIPLTDIANIRNMG